MNQEAARLTGDIADQVLHDGKNDKLTDCESASGELSVDHTVQASSGLLRPYKPRAIRTTTLLFMVILTCGLIASLDVTMRFFYPPDFDTPFDSEKRQLSDTPTSTAFFSSSRGPASLPVVFTRSEQYTATVSETLTSQQTDGGSMLNAASPAQSSSLVTSPTANSYLGVNYTSTAVMPSTTPNLPGTGAPPSNSYLQYQIDGGFTATDYFIGAYLPTLVALIYAGFWGVIDANVRRMEPFYQLARPEGDFAKDTLTFSYFSCNTFTTPCHAYVRSHWAVFCSSAAFLLASVVMPPIAASTLIVGVLPSCSNVDQKGCTGILIFRTYLSWALHAVLVLIIFMAICLIVLLRKRQMGVARDPSSIVNLAATFKGHPIMEHLQATEGNASLRSIRASLGRRRYHLLALPEDHEDSGKLHSSQSALAMNTAAPNKPRTRSRTHTLLPVVVGIILLGFIAFLVYYHQNTADNAFERFMDGQSIGVRVMMVMVGVIIKAFWQKTEQRAQFCEPYRKLMDGPSHPKDTILMRIRSSPLECFLAAAWNRHVYLAFIAFTSFSAEVLTVLLPSIPYGSTKTWQAYQVSHWLSVGILIVMLLALSWVTVRERHSRLPRSPVTIAGGLSYVCGSRFIVNLEEVETTAQCKSRTSSDIGLKERYLLDWLYDTSGVPRWIIDKERRDSGNTDVGKHIRPAVTEVV